MSALSSQFKAFLDQTEAMESSRWTDEDQEEFSGLLSTCMESVDKLHDCDSLEALVKEAGGINKHIASRFEAYGFEDFDFDTHPLNSFTELPSSVNMSVTMESFENYKKVLIGGAIAGLLLLIAKFIKWLMGRGDSDDDGGGGGGGGTPDGNAKEHKTTSREIDKLNKKIRDLERDTKKTARKAKRDQERNPPAAPPPTPLPPVDIPGRRLETSTDETYTVDDKMPLDAVRDEILVNWTDAFYDAAANAIDKMLNKEGTAINVPFLKEIVDNEVYKSLADATLEINHRLSQLLGYFQHYIVSGADSLDRKIEDIDETLLGDQSDLQKAYKNAYHLVEWYNNAPINLPELVTGNHILLERYSGEFLAKGENANMSIVVNEVLVTIGNIMNESIPNVQVRIQNPEYFLKKVENWIESQKKEYGSLEDIPKEKMEFFKKLQAEIAAIVRMYTTTKRIVDRHSVEIGKVGRFVEALPKYYEKELSEYIDNCFRHRGWENARDYRKQKSEIFKQLKMN